MIAPRQVEQGALSYNFLIAAHVPADHLLRLIDRFVDLSVLRRDLPPRYSSTGGSSVDPELMIRMLIIGWCVGIHSERRLCEEVHLNLAHSGSAGSGSTTMCPIIPPSRRAGMAVSARAISRAASLKRSCSVALPTSRM
jgi:transposase